MRSQSRQVSRARPWLGTLVEVSVWGHAELARMAIDSAFAAIAQAQRLMSAHDPASDLGRLNREAHFRPVCVHAWTADVLRYALRLHHETGGAFDCGVGAQLEKAGFLPPGTIPLAFAGPANERTVHIDASNVVRFQQPLRLDLGGIAKGYAVDRAVEALQGAGIAAGLVNAGGDLRGFGLDEWPVMVRDPFSPGILAHLLTLENGAVATSAGYHASRRMNGKRLTPIFDPLGRRFLAPDFSVTVAAPNCVTADALTKVAAILGPESAALMQRYGARVFWWHKGSLCTAREASCTAAA
jgi:thiamine biosynthesis lipoprotein